MKQNRRKQKSGNGLIGRIVRRFFLVLFALIIMLSSVLVMVMNLVFNGPSPTARDQLAMALIEASATKWVPALFIGEEAVAELRSGDTEAGLQDEVTDTNAVIINRTEITADSDEWADYPEGVRLEYIQGSTYRAYLTVVKDPSRVFVGVCNNLGTAEYGMRIFEIAKKYNALAAINAGEFPDTGTSPGNMPIGITYSQGECV